MEAANENYPRSDGDSRVAAEVLANGCRALALMSSRKGNGPFWQYPDAVQKTGGVVEVLTMAMDRLPTPGASPSTRVDGRDCQNALDNLDSPPPAQYVHLIAGGLWVIVGVASCRARAVRDQRALHRISPYSVL